MPRTMSSAKAKDSAERAAAGVMGSGYARHSGVQHSAENNGMPMLARALEAVALPADGAPFRAADLGAAAGTNSLDPMRAVVEGVRRRTGTETPVTVVHTDILDNDFNALLHNVLSTPGSYAQMPGVFAFAEARSFYEPLFPAGELHLAWTAIAVHWLSRLPAQVPGHIFSTSATGDVREAFARQAREDWNAFLTHRADELVPGGQLVVVGGAAADDGSSGAEGLMAAANAVLVELVDDGKLDESEYARMTIPTWNRTQAEFLAPLRDGPLAHAWRIEEHDLLALPDMLLEAYERTNDVDAFADQVTAFFAAAFEPSLWSALEETRDVSALASEFESRLKARIVADPRAVETHWHVVLLRLTRRA